MQVAAVLVKLRYSKSALLQTSAVSTPGQEPSFEDVVVRSEEDDLGRRPDVPDEGLGLIEVNRKPVDHETLEKQELFHRQ